jgi:translation initiation factor 2 subunit 2
MASIVSVPYFEKITCSSNKWQETTATRKSVSFSDGNVVVSADGEVSHEETGGNGNSAEAHSLGMIVRSKGLKVLSLTLKSIASPPADPEVDEVTKMFEGMTKKKPKKAKKPEAESAEESSQAGAASAADGDFEALLKKKKKKKPKADTTEDDFEAKLAEAGVVDEDESKETEVEAPKEEDGDMEKGTGVWAHDANIQISYPALLNRFFVLLHSHHPDLASSGSRSYKIPPPQCLREGNKKTIFANISEICKRMKRSDEHVAQFLFAEMGTSGSVDGSKRLVIKGKYQQKQIENILRRYISMLSPITLRFSC